MPLSGVSTKKLNELEDRIVWMKEILDNAVRKQATFDDWYQRGALPKDVYLELSRMQAQDIRNSSLEYELLKTARGAPQQMALILPEVAE